MGGRGAVAAAVVTWAALALAPGLPRHAAWAALALAVPFAWLARRAPPRTATVALLGALALAAAARGAASRGRLLDQRAALGPAGALYRIEARVATPPARAGGEPAADLVVRSAEPALVPGTRLRVRLPEDSPAEWSDRLSGLARLGPPRARRVPGGRDARAAMDAAWIAGTGRVIATAVARAPPPAGWPRATLARWRRALERRLERGLSERARALVLPLVVGDRTALPTDLGAELRAAGLVHLLALSGLHVAWLAALARALVAALGGGVRARAAAGAACALAYLGLAGPIPSLARAASAECLAALARLAGRALDPLQALAVGALVLLAAAPAWARDLGFQLSCAAALGLVTVGPWLARRCGRARPWLAPVLPTVSAQLTALPLLLGAFHAVSWIGPAANLAAVPLAGLLLAAAWLGALTDLALPGAGGPMFGACELLASGMHAVGAWAAALPGALAGTGHRPGVTACAWAGAALLALALSGPRDLEGRRAAPARARLAAAGLGAVALGSALVCATFARPMAPPAGRWWLVVLDVGQGDAIALAGSGGWRLVDAGPRTPRYDAGESAVLPFLRWAAVRRLETLALTHDDGDHTGGARAVRRSIGVGRLVSPPAFADLPGPAARFGALALARGDTLGRGPPVRVCWPPRDTLGLRGDNQGSLVLEAGESGGRALLLADADRAVEERLAYEPGVALIQVGHHGSATATGESLLARARPRAAAISVGRGNPFGHPHPAVLARLAAHRARVGRTDLEGTLWYELSADGVRRVDWRRGGPRAPSPAPSPRALARPVARW